MLKRNMAESNFWFALKLDNFLYSQLNRTELSDARYLRTGITKIELKSISLSLFAVWHRNGDAAWVCVSMCLWKIIFCGKMFLRKFINCIIMNGAVVMIVCLFVCSYCVVGCVCVCLPRYRNGKSNRYTAIWANCFTTNKMVFLLLLLK